MGWTQLAGILVDTDNLASGSARDKELATSLLVGAGSMGRNGFYNHCKHFPLRFAHQHSSILSARQSLFLFPTS